MLYYICSIRQTLHKPFAFSNQKSLQQFIEAIRPNLNNLQKGIIVLLERYINLGEPCPTYSKSAADDFENIKAIISNIFFK